MARKNDRWLIVVLLAVLAVFGLICITQRNKPTKSRASEPFAQSDLHQQTNIGSSTATRVVDDNIELIDADPQFGTGPSSPGRTRYTSENLG